MRHHKVLASLLLGGLCLLLLAPVNTFARGKVDFTGKWKLNEEKSTLGEGRFFSALEISVKQNENSIDLERVRSGRNGETRTISETLTTDGKENVTTGENRSSTSVAMWSDDKSSLTIKTDSEFNRQGQTFNMKVTEVWTLDESGKILTIHSESISQRGERSVTMVYDLE